MSLGKKIREKLEYLNRVKYSLMANVKSKKKKSKKDKGSSGNLLKIFLFVIIIVGLVVSLKDCNKSEVQQTGCEAAIKNYGREIKILSVQYDLPPEFLMSLIMLECSGRSEVPARFEQGIYQKLKEIKARRRSSLESITYDDIKDASDDALKNLASSWGPFQLMGYKCLHLGIKVRDLRGKNSLYYGVDWINRTYGDYVRKGRYADAFHIHNTGHPVPANGKYRTYDPNYIPNGLKYIEYFKKNL